MESVAGGRAKGRLSLLAVSLGIAAFLTIAVLTETENSAFPKRHSLEPSRDVTNIIHVVLSPSGGSSSNANRTAALQKAVNKEPLVVSEESLYWLLHSRNASAHRPPSKKLARHCGPGTGNPLCMQPDAERLDLTTTWEGVVCVVIFVVGYVAAIFEDSFGAGFRKSIPMTITAGVLWLIVALAYEWNGGSIDLVSAAARQNLLEFAEVFLFLLTAMTYINTMHELNVFHKLRAFLTDCGFGLMALYWATGFISFWLSPIADNLTTAVLLGAVIVAVGGSNHDFVSRCCVNIVVASNAGGAFSPFGDLTTLMIWQKGKLNITDFMDLLVPSLVNWLVPAALMCIGFPKGTSMRSSETVRLKPGAVTVIVIFLMTIAGTATVHTVAHIPPVLGMMTGLGCLKVYAFYKTHTIVRGASSEELMELGVGGSSSPARDGPSTHDRDKEIKGSVRSLDIFKRMEQTEWDTLIFFYGIIMCVGALGVMGYLDALSSFAYADLGTNTANTVVGLLSGLVDNIPMVYAVLSTDPDMTRNGWLLVTLTTGTGGSIFAIGSAAGVGMLGLARGLYTFRTHLRWTWAVLLGYFASIGTHFLLNGME